jgi:hypothetical protein
MSSFAGTPVSAPPSNIGASRSTVARSSRPRRQIVLRVSHDLRRNLRDLPPCGRSARVELIFRPGQPLVLPRIDSVRFRSSSFPPPDGPSFACGSSPFRVEQRSRRPSTAGCLSGARRSRFRVLERLADSCSRSRAYSRKNMHELVPTNPHEARVAFVCAPELLAVPEFANTNRARGTQPALSVRTSFDADAAPLVAREASPSSSPASSTFRSTIRRCRARCPQDSPLFYGGEPSRYAAFGRYPAVVKSACVVTPCFASGDAARSFDQVAPDPPFDLAISRRPVFACPRSRAHAPPLRPFRAERRKAHSFEQTSAKAPCGNIDRPRLVSLTLVSFVLRRSRRLFFRVNRQQPVPFDRYPFGPFGGRATSLAAVTPRTLSSQPPRSLAPHGAGARENCARSSSAYCHRVAWLQCLHLSRPARASEPSIQTSALRFGHFRNLTTRANSR